MRSEQREGRRPMIETPAPVDRRLGMTLDAIGTEPRGTVRRNGGCIVLCPVAAEALDRHRHILMDLFIGVACLTGSRLVPAHKRESRLPVTGDHIRDNPASRRVASLALCPEFAAMDIFVAGNAPRRGVRKTIPCMAIGATDRPVLALQSKPRTIVIEVHRVPRGLPS
jgi:hypothetical protein